MVVKEKLNLLFFTIESIYSFKMEKLLKKDFIIKIQETFSEIILGKKTELTANPVRIFESYEIEISQGSEKLFKLFFTKDRENVKNDFKIASPKSYTDMIFFWIYYKIYDFDEQIEKICNDDPLNYLFLIDNFTLNFTKERSETEKFQIIFSKANPLSVVVQNKEYNLLELLNFDLTEEQFGNIFSLLSLSPEEFWKLSFNKNG